MNRLSLPPQMRFVELLTGFFVPGLAVYLRGPWTLGLAALGVSAALFSVYVIWLGHGAANLAFGMLMSLHCTGFVYYCSPSMAQAGFQRRLFFTIMVLVAMMGLLYWPSRNLVQEHWLTPLRINNQVVVVQRIFAVSNIQRGDWIAYSLKEYSEGEAHNGGAVWFHGGTGLGPVLAIAGDHVSFSAGSYSVNGVNHLSFPHMPQAGEWIVPEKHWFIWPNLAISGHGNVSEGAIDGALLQLADVAPDQYFGQPLHHWFWRQQKLP